MLDSIRTIFGAVATKDIVPILTHILIYEGRMQAGDGCVTIDTPFPNSIKPCAVPGQKLLQAVKGCGDAPDLSITDGGKLSIKKGKFRAFLSTLPKEDFPIESPEGEVRPVPANFLSVITALRPFVSKDASRPWSMGIMLRGGYAYATNNIVLSRHVIDWDYEDALIPLRALDDLMSMGENPTSLSSTPSSVTFFYRDNSWLRTQVLLSPWPDIEKMLAGYEEPTENVPADLLNDVTKVRVFCTNQKFPQITLGACVESDDGGDKASVDGYDLPKSVWHADHLELVLRSATKIDFSGYPKPCAFSNEKGLFGIFVGVKS